MVQPRAKDAFILPRNINILSIGVSIGEKKVIFYASNLEALAGFIQDKSLKQDET